MARRRILSGAGFQPTTDAGAAFASNMQLRQQNRAGADSQLGQVEQTFGDPMHAQALNNATQTAINAATDVQGTGAVLQGLKNAIGEHRGRVGFNEPTSGPSMTSPASWNPAGMTEDAATAQAQQFAKGGAVPDWLQGAAPDTQEAFRRRVVQGIRGARFSG